MKFSSVIFVVCMLFAFVVYASPKKETIKIVQIIDANLFRLADGRLVQLADVQVPSLNSDFLFPKLISRKAFNYARKMLLGHRCVIRYDSSRLQVGKPLSVYLFKIFPLEKLDVNKLYLMRGYGKFVPSKASLYRREYRAAERYAQSKHIGIWGSSKTKAEISMRRHCLYYRGGNRNLFGDEFREIGFYSRNESPVSLAEFRIAFVRSAEKGRTCTDCADAIYYEEYVHHYRSGYLQLIFGKKWKRTGLSIGFFGCISGTKYRSEESSYLNLSPIIRMRYFLPNDFYLKAALTDNYGFLFPDYPVELAIGKYVSNQKLHVWGGLVKHRSLWNIVSGCEYNLGPYSINAFFGHGINYNSTFAELQLGFLIH